MITDVDGHSIETFDALIGIVEALDKRFPEHNSATDRVARLAEETGELAAEVNHAQGAGMKNTKHGEFTPDKLVKEVEDVLRAALAIAHHYGVVSEVQQSVQKHYRMNQDKGFIPSKADA